MKRFIDENGTFEVRVPTTWKYSLQNEKVHTFQEYEIWKPDAFQISIQEPNGETQLRFQSLTKNLTSTEISGIKYYNFPESGGEDFITKSWTTFIEDRIVLFTLTHSVNQDIDLVPKSLEEKLKEVNQIISSFRIIKPEESESKINSYRFDMFLQGVGATAYMLNKAVGNHAFIEATCLLASQIDCLLRIGIVLQKPKASKYGWIRKS